MHDNEMTLRLTVLRLASEEVPAGYKSLDRCVENGRQLFSVAGYEPDQNGPAKITLPPSGECSKETLYAALYEMMADPASDALMKTYPCRYEVLDEEEVKGEDGVVKRVPRVRPVFYTEPLPQGLRHRSGEPLDPEAEPLPGVTGPDGEWALPPWAVSLLRPGEQELDALGRTRVVADYYPRLEPISTFVVKEIDAKGRPVYERDEHGDRVETIAYFRRWPSWEVVVPPVYHLIWHRTFKPDPSDPSRMIVDDPGCLTRMLYVPPMRCLLGEEKVQCAEGGFWLNECTVTNYEYNGHGTEEPLKPRVSVEWDKAVQWSRSKGLALPQEFEWEAAARGWDGRTYPWGEDEPNDDLLIWSGSGKSRSGPEDVGSCPKGAAPFGHLDMAGNVWEWTGTPWSEKPNYPLPNSRKWHFDKYAAWVLKEITDFPRGWTKVEEELLADERSE